MPVTAAVDPEPRRAALDLAWTEALRCFLIDLRRRGYSLLTLRDYQSDVMRLRRFAGDAAPSEVTGAHVDAALETWRRVGFGLPVLRRKRSALRSFLRFQEARRRTAGRVADLWARASKLPAADRLLFGFVAAAGARLPELCAVEGRDLRLKSGVVHLRAGLRIVPLHPALRALVEEVRREAPLLAFRPILPGANGFPVNTRTLHARFRRLAQRIGAPTLRPDDLRRELAAHLVEQQVPQGLIAAFLARDRGRPVAPRHGQMTDLTCLAERLGSFPLGAEAESRALGAAGY